MTSAQKAPASQSQVNALPLWRAVRRVFSHLSTRRRWQLVGLFLLMLLGAVAEIATLGAVMPFLALLTTPDAITQYPVIQKFFQAVGWARNEDFLYAAILLFGGLSLAAGALRMLIMGAIYKWSFGTACDFGTDVYRRVLYQSYAFHVARNSSEIISALNKVDSIVFTVLIPIVQGVVSIVISVAILGALARINATAAGAACTGFAVIYLVTTLLTRRELHKNARILATSSTKRVQAIQEGLGGIRDIIIDGTQPVYVRRYRELDLATRDAQANNAFIGSAPRFLIESIGMVLIAGLAYWMSTTDGGLSNAIPVLGALAIGAQRIFPQMQQIYFGWASLAGSSHALSEVAAMLDYPIEKEHSTSLPVERLPFEHNVRLRDVCFYYRGNGRLIIRSMNLKLQRGERIGLIGATGSGKSTLVDLIMGLLTPTSGQIEVDGVKLTNANRREWQSCIAHVPQSIYLSDATIAENIAFGLGPENLDEARVRWAASMAQLADFIETLPEGYLTIVGERGVKLSGGQRQRIGLARALYKNASILILDEATSALDDRTEEAVMTAIDSLCRNVTVIMIAHRLSSLKSCDRIFELKNGELLKEWTFSELIAKPLTEDVPMSLEETQTPPVFPETPRL